MPQRHRKLSLLCALSILTLFVPGLVRADVPMPVDRAAWATRLANMDFTHPDDYQGLRDLAGLHGDIGYEILRDNWTKITHDQVRANATYLFASNPHAYDILKLGAADPSAEVQSAAFAVLVNYAFQNFAGDGKEYAVWLERNQGKSPEEIVRDNERAFLERIKTADESTRPELVRQLTLIDFVAGTPLAELRRQVALDSGVLDSLAEYLPPTLSDNPPMSAWWTLQLIESLKPDSTYLRKVMVPLVAHPLPAQMKFRVVGVIASRKERWASDLLVKLLIDHYPDPLSRVVALYLPTIADIHAVPPLIGLLASDESGESNALIGEILKTPTNVEPDDTHDGVWWTAWWEKNRARLDADVQAEPIPKLRPLSEILGAKARSLVAAVIAATDNQKVSSLLTGIQQEIQWSQYGGYSGRFRFGKGAVSSGAPLLKLRIKALKDAMLPEALAKYVTVEAAGRGDQVFWQSMQIIARLQPGEEFGRRVLLPLMAKSVNLNVRSQAVLALGNPASKWAEPILLNMFLQEYPDQSVWPMAQALGAIGDPHAIPTLIGLLEADDTDMAANVIGQALMPLTGLSYDQAQNVDGEWWHGWWLQHRSKFPVEARSLPVPRITLRKSSTPEGFHIRRKAAYHQIGEDPGRAFWLITPGFISDHAPQLAAAPQGNRESPLGLIVVLGSGSAEEKTVTDFWLEATQKAFRGRYLIALALPPKQGGAVEGKWKAKTSRTGQAEVKDSAEAMSADIVQEVCRRYPIHPDRIFLHGAGSAGQAVYACSLEPKTPFRGFYVLDAPFRSAELPAPGEAKGRLFVIQHSREDKTTGLWLAEAAQKILVQKGAKVRLDQIDGGPGYTFHGDRWMPLTAAVDWLQSGALEAADQAGSRKR